MSDQHAEYVALQEAVAKLHHAIKIRTLSYACANEDCDHGDHDECEAAGQDIAVCAHCNEIRETVAFNEDASYAIEPWPCPTARAARIDGGEGA